MTPLREQVWLVNSLDAAGVRLEGLSVVEAHYRMHALLLTGRAPGPADFWRGLLEAHGVAPARPGVGGSGLPENGLEMTRSGGKRRIRGGRVTNPHAWADMVAASGLAVDRRAPREGPGSVA